MPQLRSVLDANYVTLDDMLSFTAGVEARLNGCLRRGDIPDADLVEAIAVCKIRGIAVVRARVLRFAACVVAGGGSGGGGGVVVVVQASLVLVGLLPLRMALLSSTTRTSIGFNVQTVWIMRCCFGDGDKKGDRGGAPAAAGGGLLRADARHRLRARRYAAVLQVR
jgi:hypothetical protein